MKVDTLGGDVISSELLKYDAELDSKTPFVLLKDTKEHVYIAQSGLIGKTVSILVLVVRNIKLKVIILN